MDSDMDAYCVLLFSVWLLLQLLSAPLAIFVPPPPVVEEEEDIIAMQDIVDSVGEVAVDALANVNSTLLNFRLCTSLPPLHDNLGFWVKPRSTTWFSRFLLYEYDDTRWRKMFRFTKAAVFALADLLAPHVRKKDTKYRLSIPVVIRVACTLFKLTHGASLCICSEMFAIGRSTVSAILRDVVHAINDTLKQNLSWPRGDRLLLTQQRFFELCSLPAVVGAIDGTHVSIAKPRHCPADYYYFKSGGYTLNCQAVVDSDKRFLDLYLGMPGSTNDSRVLRRSSLHDLAVHNNFFDEQQGSQGFAPYLIGDLGYPLLPWLMVPHRSSTQLSVAEALFNKKLRRGRCVVENAFGILKQTFRELLTKSDLDVAFLPDVILCCAILHNMLLGQTQEEVENFLQVLRTEGLHAEVVDDASGRPEVAEVVPDNVATAVATLKRRDLGLHLTMQRQQQA